MCLALPSLRIPTRILAVHARYHVLDLSYYKGKFYLYFGVTPALVLFWPYLLLTGHYLPQRLLQYVSALLVSLAGVGRLCALWLRYFIGVNVAVIAAVCL